MKFKKQISGITLISVVVAVTILLIISGMLIYNAKNGIETRNLKWMQNDIEILDNKIDSYYVKYGALPIMENAYTNIKFEPQANDSQEYYVIDLKALDGLTLNYGNQYIDVDDSNMQEKDDVYIIDKQSHHIYYARGIELDGVRYYTITEDEEINIVEIPKNIKVELTYSPTEPTKSVTLKGIAKSESSGLKIKGYVFIKGDGEPSLEEFEEVSETEKIEKTKDVTENGTYYFWVVDNNGDLHRSDPVVIENIDDIAPEAGILVNKEDNKEFDKENPTEIYQDVTIKKIDGKGEETEEIKTTYTIEKDGSIHIITDENGQKILAENITEPSETTLTEAGTYTITVTTSDTVGNVVENKYIIIINKAVPILALKHNDENGAIYEQGTWTKDDLYGEITIDTSKTVEKYQYSLNKIKWNDISEIPTVMTEPLDYTINDFNNITDKPEWIGELENEYNSFEVGTDGKLYPTNIGKNGEDFGGDIFIPYSISRNYIEIDLTQYPYTKLDITVNATISCEPENDYGYLAITYDESTPSSDFFAQVSGEKRTENYTTTISGGQKYYLHIGYYKNSSISSGDDSFIINSINFKSEGLIPEINFANYSKDGNLVKFNLNTDIDKKIVVRGVYEEGRVSNHSNEMSIMIDKTAPVVENINAWITIEDVANVKVKVKEEGSGIKGYYLSEDETNIPTEETSWAEEINKEFTLEGLSINKSYYLWTIDNVNNISQPYLLEIGDPNYEIDSSIYTDTIERAIAIAKDGSTIKLLNDYTDTTTAIFDKNIIFDVQNNTLIMSSEITINEQKTLEIKGTGKIKDESYLEKLVINNGILTLNSDITIESQYGTAIYNSLNESIINVSGDAKVIGKYVGIENDGGILNINGGVIESTSESSSGTAISNNEEGKIYLNSGVIQGYYGINSKGMIEVTGGKIVGKGAPGIQSYDTVNIFGGRIEGKTYGIYSIDSEKLTIGRQEDELSTTIPAIYGASYGIYMSDNNQCFNFYNGVILSKTKTTAYRGNVNPRENHMPYTYYDGEIEEKWCTILSPVVEKIIMEATPTEYTNGNVTVKITYPYTNDVKQYSENGIDWVETTNYYNEIIIGENKIVYARTINETGIITNGEQIEINNIDKEKPVVTVSPTETIYTIKETDGTIDLSLTFTASDTGVSGLDIVQYAWAKEGTEPTYVDFTGTVILDKNNLGIGQYNLYFNVTDKAGNKADFVQMRYTVKYEEPVAKIGDTKYITVQDAVDACSKETTKEQITAIDYTTNFPMVSGKPDRISEPVENGNYYFEVQNDGTLKPNNSGVKNSTANSYFEIDLTGHTETEVQIELTLNATISSESGYDYGYATITEETTAPAYSDETGRFIYISGSSSEKDYTTTLTGGKKYYLHIGYRKDSSGNSGDDTFIINSLNIKGTIPQMVIEEPTTIELLKSTDEEFITYEGQSIILDLKGYTIGSSNTETPICTNNATLQLIDSSAEQTGKLESLNGIAVLNNGVFIIGDNSTSIENEIPTIYGQKIGVENNNIFNFYDGKIQGITPIQGNVNDTPEEYGPVSTDYNNGITTVQLGIVTGYEARIEWVYYTTLEDAVKATRRGGIEKDTVTIIKNIQLKDTLSIDDVRCMILDLNGLKLTVDTSTNVNSVIDNYGDLEIRDSSIEKTGNISITTILIEQCYAINNTSSGTLNIAEGTINSSNSGYSYGIYNNQGIIQVTGGAISGIGDKNSYGIYNTGEGSIEVTGGMISSRCINGDYPSYAIYNKDAGRVEVKGGTISSGNAGGHSSTYGILNTGKGCVEITGGTISSSNYNNSISYGIYNINEGRVEVKGGTISSNNGYSFGACEGIYNSGKGYIKVTGGTISSSGNSGGNGIYNSDSGSVEVTGGMITSIDGSERYGIENRDSGSVKVTGGTISSIGEENSYGIYNNNSGSVKVTGGMISTGTTSDSDSYSYGIYNNDEGSVEVTEGTISSSSDYNSYGIYNNKTGNITIGIKENILVSQDEPNIKGEYTGTSTDYVGYGIYNKIGNVEFYNGIIQGTTRAIIGNITEKREGYEIKNEVIDELDSIYLIEAINIETIVKIGEKEFCTITEAIESIENNEETTIEVLKDFELKEVLDWNKNIVLDLKGYSIINNYYQIKNTGILKITDTSNGQTGKIENNETLVGIINEGEKLVIERGIISTCISYGTSYGVYNYSEGSIEVTGGTISSRSSYGTSHGINNNLFYKNGIYNSVGGRIEVTGGMISSIGYKSSYGIFSSREESIHVTGGTINSSNSYSYGNSYGIRNAGVGRVEVIGGNISCSSEYSGYGILNDDEGSVEVTGGTISTNGRKYGYGIYNSSSGCVKVTEGTINSSSIYNSSNGGGSYAIYNDREGSIEVTGGTICSSSDYYGYGIYNRYTGSITIGTKGDGLVSQEEPNIKGEYTGTSTDYNGYGIYNTRGYLYLYDGVIEGTKKAIYDTITEREENTELNYNEDETILTLSSEIQDIAQIEDTTYKTLEEAINAVGEEQTTIKILRNATFTNQDTTIIIPNTKNIILDMNGYKIISSIPETLMRNEGILQIIDTSENEKGCLISRTEQTINNYIGAKLIISNATIENSNKYSIYNQGELIIEGGTITSYINHIYGNSYGIYNSDEGSIEITGGTISSRGYYNSYGIYNSGEGSIEITGGVVSTVDGDDAYGIYNNRAGSVTVTGGMISVDDGGDAYGIYNNGAGSVAVTGGTISIVHGRDAYGIYNNGVGSVAVTGGIISSSSHNDYVDDISYGIYNINAGSITIGTKGDGLVSQDVPIIIGVSTSSSIGDRDSRGYGIYNLTGYLYLYDGKIEGTTQAVNGTITEVEDMTELLITKDSSEIIQLQTKTTKVASVNGVEYDSIQEAVLACGEVESTIKILRDAAPGATIVIGSGQNITIDLNGYTVKNYPEITNNGTLKIIDTSSSKAGKMIGLNGTVVLNKGTMELNGGSITDTGYGINNKDILTVNGGNLTNNTYGVYNNAGTINMMTGTISSNTYGIYNYRGTTEITGGNITLNENGVYISDGTVNIKTIAISNNEYGIYVTGGTTNIKEGAQVSSVTGIYNTRGIVNIGETGTMNSSSPVIIGEEYGLVNATIATVNMYDGQIKGKIGATQGFITNTETGYIVGNKVEGEYFVDYLALAGTISTVAQVNGIDYSNLQSAINSIVGEGTVLLTNGINSSQSYTITEGQNITLDMNGKTISSDIEVTINNAGNLTIIDSSGMNVGKISSSSGTAIVNSGTLTLGTDDGTVNQELITIEGTTYGIENSGTLNFYDGTINGASAVSGTITNRATGYLIRTTTVNGKERYYLSI